MSKYPNNLGLRKYFLGIEVKQYEVCDFISQSMYATYIWRRFKILNWKWVGTQVVTWTKLSKIEEGSKVDPTPLKRMFGSLIYSKAKRLYIIFIVSLISRFTKSIKSMHWQVEKKHSTIYYNNSRIWNFIFIKIIF